MKIVKIAFFWPEARGFKRNRPNGVPEYNFLHFWDPAEIILNGEKIVTAPHACIIYKPNTPQCYSFNEKSTQDWFRFEGDIDAIMEKYGLECNTIYYPENYSFISSLTRKMELEFTCQSKYSDDICEAYLNEFFILLSREVSVKTEASNINQATRTQLIQLRRQIQREYSKPWTIDDMASLINLSPSYLHAIYKQFFGVSPLNDLISVRIERACLMLSGTKKSNAEIAANLGYNTTSHFMRQFSKKMGMSPREYRRQTKVDDLPRDKVRDKA